MISAFHITPRRLGVVADSGNGPGTMGAVPVKINRVIIVTIEVPAMGVIDIPVAVIIDPITRDLLWIHPDICSEVRVGIHDPGIDDGDDHVPGSCGDGPCLRCVNIGVWSAGYTHDRLPGVVQAPEVIEFGIVWDYPRTATAPPPPPDVGMWVWA
jgi:hypothetical protein